MESDVNIKEGYKKTAVGVIPEEWEVKRLKEIGNFYRGKGIPKSDVIENGLKAIRYGEIYTIHHYYIKEFQSFISKNTAETSFLIKKNDVLFTSSGETLEDIGKSVAYLGDEEAYAGGDTIILRPLKNKFDSKFLGFATNSDAFRVQTYRMGQGHSVVHIYPSNLKKTKLPIPPLPEQKAIANCLTTWDSGIEKLSALIKAKKEQKKGLMQQLLTGEKRLDGFEGEWKKVLLGNIAHITTGSSNKQDAGHKYTYTFFDRSSDILTSKIYLYDCEAIIVPGEGADFMPKYFVGKFDLHQRAYAIMDYKGASGKFIFYYLLNDRKHLHSQAVGSTVRSLRLPYFKNMPLVLPSLKEQTAIANVLTTADKEITLLEKKLEGFKEQKRGLMQVLLTGERRLIEN